MVAEAAAKSVATPFTGAWGDIQLALTNVVVQSIPDLSKGSVSRRASSTARLAAAQKAAQSAAGPGEVGRDRHEQTPQAPVAGQGVSAATGRPPARPGNPAGPKTGQAAASPSGSARCGC